VRALLAMLALALAFAAAARVPPPPAGRAPAFQSKDKPDAGDDDEEDRG